MAEHRTDTGGQHGSHPPALACECGVPDGVDAVVQAMKPAGPRAAVDRVVAEPERSQLRTRHDAVLSSRERRDWHVRGAKTAHIAD